ncbi:MAG: hypothetical protein KAY50_10460 [Chitinophagaceae bacterium]|nr:hypothetical protein [Chitinophagaceae bacterium]
MNRKFFTNLICFICSIILLTSCAKKQEDEKCISTDKAPVTKIEGATTASVNQEINLTVSFICFNGCGQFGNMEETIAGNTTTIIVNAKYTGCICTQDVPTRMTSFKFKKAQAGTYELKFWQTENNYLIHSIIVQ